MKKRVGAGLIAASTAVLVLPGGSVAVVPQSAARAEAPGYQWRVLKRLGAKEGGFTAVHAFSGKDIWAFSATTTDSEWSLPKASHWNGRAWRTIALPAWVRGLVTETDGVSGTSLWTNLTNDSAGEASGLQGVLHWNGESLTAKRLPGFHTPGVVALGRDRVLAFTNGIRDGQPVSAVSRFDGRAWTSRTTPGLQLLSRPVAHSARDAWAVAYVEASEERPFLQAVFHHDGRTWKKRNPPRRLLKIDPRECIANWPADSGNDPTEECPAEGRPLEVAALAGDDVLVSYDLDPNWIGLSKRTRLLRWDGRRWARLGKDLPWSLRRLTGDGSGGFWAIVTRRDREFILHRTKSGRLLKYPLTQKSRRLTYTDLSVSRSGTVVATGYTADQNGDDARQYVWKLTGRR